MRDFNRGLLKFLGFVLVVALIAGGILYGFFVKVVQVGHNAMAPTVIAGDTVLVWKTTNLELGDLAFCPHPQAAGRYVMGRVVGRPGQMVAIDTNGGLAINGQSPDRDLHGEITFSNTETGRQEQHRWADETILDHDYRIFWRQGRSRSGYNARRVQGGLFLLNDNRSYTGEDSRSFGGVSANTCIGVVFMRLAAAPSPPEIGNGALDIIR